MSTVQNSQEKRTIRVKDFLDDFRSGMSDEDLLVKYNLTPTGLDKFYGMLQDRGILDIEEIEARFEPVDPPAAPEVPTGRDGSSFICPSCLASQDIMFDVCPKCGVSFQEMISQDDDDLGPVPHHATDKLGADPRDQESDFGFFDSFSGNSQSREVDTPEDSFNVTYFAESAPVDKVSTHFLQGEDLSINRGRFNDTPDEIFPGLPLEAYADNSYAPSAASEALCEGCKEKMAPTVRDVYDRERSLHALAGSGICILMGFLGIAALGWFESYSFGRLMVVYFTGVSMIFGAVLSAVGSFMYLAREKVFLCSGCERVYPRG